MAIVVVVTSIGSTGSQNVLKSLRAQTAHTARLIGVDAQEAVAGRKFVEAFWRVPPATNPVAYVAALRSICREGKADLLIPIMEPELEAVAQHREAFAPTVAVVSSAEAIATCNDKRLAHAFFERLGVPSPQRYTPESARFPCIVKPPQSAGTKGVLRIDSRRDLEAAWSEGMLIEECIEGEEYTIDTFSDLRGEFVGAVPRKRLEVKGGLSTKSLTVNDPEMTAWAEKIVTSLPILGPANLQCIRGRDGLRFIEINPRFGGAYILSIRAGLDAPRFLLDCVAGEPIRYSGYQAGLRMLRYWEEVYERDPAADGV
ncbi:MAG: ATP-grasp domain-containing protein [Candidatus Sumerlaeota bacterium]|nr:ATP-grasp domain-containing protein [Candidatus Sumerlaeota bacterium]